MNENPGGTPNPLNPNPAPVQPLGPQPAAPAAPAQPIPAAPANPVTSPEVNMPVEPATPAGAAEPTASAVPATPVAPAELTMQTEPKDSIVEPKKKSKKGPVIALVVLLIALICGGVAAAIVFLNPFAKKDAVPAAIAKLMSGDAPQNVSMNGKVTMTMEGGLASSLTINFTAGLNNATMGNYASATVTAGLIDGSEFTFSADEVHVEDGDFYLKISGLADAINDYKPPLLDYDAETNCIGDESGETNCLTEDDILSTDCVTDEFGDVSCVYDGDFTSSILGFASVFEVIDDEWIRIPGSSFSNVTDLATLDQPTQCLIDAAGELGNYGSNFATLYNNNPFITYSTENLKITQKKDTLYKLGFNTNELAGFINGLGNSGFMNEMFACMNGEAISTGQEVTASDLSEIVAMLPTIYVEIDDDDNFTRVYLTVSSDDATATADISLSYPSTITIEEPESYIELNEILTNVLTVLYGQDITTEF